MTFQHVTFEKFICSIYLPSLVQILKTLTEPKSEKVSITEFLTVRKSLLPRKRMVLPSAGAKQIPVFCAHFTPPCNPLRAPGRQSLPPALWPARLTHMESTMDSLAFWLQVQLMGNTGRILEDRERVRLERLFPELPPRWVATEWLCPSGEDHSSYWGVSSI